MQHQKLENHRLIKRGLPEIMERKNDIGLPEPDAEVF